VTSLSRASQRCQVFPNRVQPPNRIRPPDQVKLPNHVKPNRPMSAKRCQTKKGSCLHRVHRAKQKSHRFPVVPVELRRASESWRKKALQSETRQRKTAEVMCLRVRCRVCFSRSRREGRVLRIVKDFQRGWRKSLSRVVQRATSVGQSVAGADGAIPRPY